MLSLLLPLLAGVVTRLALRPRGQGQQQNPLTIDLSAGWLAVIWVFSVLIALLGLAGPTGGEMPEAFALIIGAGVVGVLIPEIFRGLGQATATGLSKPKNWLWLIGVLAVLYGLFINPDTLEGLFLLGMMFPEGFAFAGQGFGAFLIEIPYCFA